MFWCHLYVIFSLQYVPRRPTFYGLGAYLCREFVLVPYTTVAGACTSCAYIFLLRTDKMCRTCTYAAMRKCCHLVHGATVGLLLHHHMRSCCAPVTTWAAVSPEHVCCLHLTGCFSSRLCAGTKIHHQLPVPGILIVCSPLLKPVYTSTEGTAGAAGTDDVIPSGRPLSTITRPLLSTPGATPTGMPMSQDITARRWWVCTPGKYLGRRADMLCGDESNGGKLPSAARPERHNDQHSLMEESRWRKAPDSSIVNHVREPTQGNVMTGNIALNRRQVPNVKTPRRGDTTIGVASVLVSYLKSSRCRHPCLARRINYNEVEFGIGECPL